MSGGDARHWPFGAVQPWNQSLSHWHAWASQMPAALASSAAATGDRAARTAAARVTRSPSTRGCSPRAAPTTAGSRPAPTAPRSPTAWTRASSRWSRPAADAKHRRHHRRLVLRRQRVRRAGVRPRDRRHHRRDRRRRHREPQLRRGVDDPRPAHHARAGRAPDGRRRSRMTRTCRSRSAPTYLQAEDAAAVRRRHRREADVDVDRRGAVRRHRLRLAAGRQHRDLRPRAAPGVAGHPGGRPAAVVRAVTSFAAGRVARLGALRRHRRAGRLADAPVRCCR